MTTWTPQTRRNVGDTRTLAERAAAAQMIADRAARLAAAEHERAEQADKRAWLARHGIATGTGRTR